MVVRVRVSGFLGTDVLFLSIALILLTRSLFFLWEFAEQSLRTVPLLLDFDAHFVEASMALATKGRVWTKRKIDPGKGRSDLYS